MRTTWRRFCSAAQIVAVAVTMTRTAIAQDAVPERVTFPSADGHTTLVGYIYAPSTKAKLTPAVVMMHGRAGPYSTLAKGRYDATTLSQRHRMWGRLWAAQGFVVHGAALSGKAAEGLEESSGIASRTLASWDYGLSAGRVEFGSRDILVIDEAGMVSSKQLARFIGEAERDAWLRHMRSAIKTLDPPPAVGARLEAYFETVAEGMRNRP